jgi:hypothetical protein
MHEQESNELSKCLDCGALIAPGSDRAFAISDDDFLCFDCAVRRGGVYDGDRDDWSVAPGLADEPDERRPHP